VTGSELEGHLGEVRSWLRRQPHFEICYVDYGEVLSEPLAVARRIRGFLGRDLDVEAMAAVVDPSLHRERGDAR
jgi:hypothetical protein